MPPTRMIEFEETESGCFEVTSHSTNGTIKYPRITRKRKDIAIHRFIYEECFGQIPAGHYVCHHCDNKKCINPEHLYAGTPADNARDASERFCLPYGENHHMARLNTDDVLFIRSSNDTHANLARRYGVNEATVACVRHRKSWRHLT